MYNYNVIAYVCFTLLIIDKKAMCNYIAAEKLW